MNTHPTATSSTTTRHKPVITATFLDQAIVPAGDRLALEITISHSTDSLSKPIPKSISSAAFLPSSSSSDSLSRTPTRSNRWSWFSTLHTPTPHLLPSPDADHLTHLSLGTVQLVGTITIDPLSIDTHRLSTLKHYAASSGLHLAVNEYPVFVSSKSILFVDLKISMSTTSTYTYYSILPVNLPSSVRRNRYLNLNYRVIVDCYLNNKPLVPYIQLVAPFRVFSSIDTEGVPMSYNVQLPIIQSTQVAAVICNTEAKPLNTVHDSYLKLLDRIDDSLDCPELLNVPIALILKLEDTSEVLTRINYGAVFRHVDQLITSAPIVVFDFGSDRGPVAKMKLKRSVFRIGDIINGVLDFRNAAVPSIHLIVVLETTESVDLNYSLQGLTRTLKKTVGEIHTNVLGTRMLPFSIKVPETAMPSYTTSIGSFRYQLRVELAVQTQPQANRSLFKLIEADELYASLACTPNVEAEMLVCELPVSILPSHVPMYKDTYSSRPM